MGGVAEADAQLRDLLPVHGRVYAPPSEQASVDRPTTWSDHRQCGCHGSCQQARQWLLGDSQDVPDLDYSNDRSSDGCPQARDEKKSHCRKGR